MVIAEKSCCPNTPPAAVKSRGTRGQRDAQILAKQDNPHVFALGLKDACCEEPCCCIVSALGAPFGCTACWARKAVLEKYSANGLDDYVCCQGYIPQICCCDPSTWCAGSRLALACEGLCCPVFSLSLARLHMMDAKQNRPDPCDYQIIWCSNILQLVSCVLDVVAIFVKGARDLAHLVDLVADLFTCSVAGCMGAQVYHEIAEDSTEAGVVYIVAQGVPVDVVVLPGQAPPGSLASQDHQVPVAEAQTVVVLGQPAGAPPNDEMER